MTSKPSDSTGRQIIRLRGIAASGINQSSLFTEIPWVKKQFVEKLNISPYPGTFNINVVPEDSEMLNRVKAAKGIEIVPEDKNFCAATSFPVLVNRKIPGAVIIPLVSDYPPAKLEIIATENIKQSLSLKDGDQVEITVYL